MKRPQYICLEGLDGSGKTTAYEAVLKKLSQKGYRVCGLCPTKSVCSCADKSRCTCHNIEQLFNRCPALRNSRFFRQFLYAYRSNRAAKGIDWDADLILGDRSIVTSYICRWTGSKLHDRLLVFAVDRLENRIPAPDHILYLDVPAEELHRRLAERGEPDIDETCERSSAMRKAYGHLRTTPGAIKRLQNVQWHTINGARPREEVADEVLNRIENMI